MNNGCCLGMIVQLLVFGPFAIFSYQMGAEKVSVFAVLAWWILLALAGLALAGGS